MVILRRSRRILRSFASLRMTYSPTFLVLVGNKVDNTKCIRSIAFYIE